MISVSDLRVILNKVKDIDLSQVPKRLHITIEGESPSIFDGSYYPPRRVQGLMVKISGDKKLVDLFLKKYESTGVYLK